MSRCQFLCCNALPCLACTLSRGSSALLLSIRIKTVELVDVAVLPPSESALAADPTSSSEDANRLLPSLPQKLDVEIRVKADGFLYNQVRNMVAALVEVGLGARSVGWIQGLLIAQDRSAMPRSAPAAGLYLREVGYSNLDAVSDAHHATICEAEASIAHGMVWADGLNLDEELRYTDCDVASPSSAHASIAVGPGSRLTPGAASNASAAASIANAAGVGPDGVHYTFQSRGARWSCELRSPCDRTGSSGKSNTGGGGSSSSGKSNGSNGTGTFVVAGTVPSTSSAAASTMHVPKPVVRQLLGIAAAQRQVKQPLYFPHRFVAE